MQVAALLLVTAYRIAGSRWATLDPLKRMPRPQVPELEAAYYDLSEADLDREVSAGSFVGLDRTSLRNLIHALRDTYCGNIGFEYMYIGERAQRDWIQQRVESVRATPQYTPEVQKRLLQRLTAAEMLERYLHTRYVGQKRFSLEGGESLIPSIDELMQRAGAAGVQEIVIGMAHRGRLNVLVNMLGKMPKDLFQEFEGKHAHELPMGDVKYHQGFSSDISTGGGPVHVSLAFNPSHLEIVNPVVEGSVRARQRRRDDKNGDQVLPILIHGDAAFAGQGVVMETLNLSRLAVTAPAERCTSWSTTRSASPPRIRATHARRSTAPTSRRWSRRRSSTSTATIRRRCCSSPRWRSTSGSSSRRTW